MKYSGIVSLALSTLVAASPTAPPAKFALQVTANGQTLFLGKAGDGSPVKDKAQAAACSIVPTARLSCDGKIMGINPHKGFGTLKNVDMAPITVANPEVANPLLNPITVGFSLDANNMLHLKNATEFTRLNEDGHNGIVKNQGGEAEFGIYTGKLFFQLGCPQGTHNGLHGMVQIGTAKAIPL